MSEDDEAAAAAKKVRIASVAMAGVVVGLFVASRINNRSDFSLGDVGALGTSVLLYLAGAGIGGWVAYGIALLIERQRKSE